MKRLILQVNVKIPDDEQINGKRFIPKEEIYEISEIQAKKFAKIWNVDYYQVTDNNFLPDKHPVYQRFKMYEMDYDQILYLDMDAIILPKCPNIFDRFANHKFSAVRDSPWDKTTGRSQDEKRAMYNEIYGAKEDYRPFCSGIMLVRRDFLEETKNDWRQYLYSFDKQNAIKGGHDQSIFNKLVINLGGNYNELNEDWGPWYRSGKYIDHLGGPFTKHAFNKDVYCSKKSILGSQSMSLENFLE